MRTLIIFGITMIALTGCNSKANEGSEKGISSKIKEGYESGFKESFGKKIVESCKDETVKSGATQDQAKAFCDCFSKYLTDKYDSTQLMKLSGDSSAESDKMVAEASNACQK